MLLEITLDEIPDARRVAVLMRHAERDPIVTVEDSLGARLNDAGKAHARSLGEKLARFENLRFFHSPVERCRQTAEEIAAGAETRGAKPRMGGELFDLGGPYMKDWRAVMKRVFDIGAGTFVRDWFGGRLPPGLAMEPAAAAGGQLAILADQLADPDWSGATINVTHDWNMLLVRNHYFDLDQRALGWPDYLEGVAAFQQDGRLMLQFGPHRVTVNP
jgi:broad specificity phosphatase PhoE